MAENDVMQNEYLSELDYMDRQFSRACALQLKAWVRQLQAMRPELDGDLAEYADALLIKLNYGIECEQAQVRRWAFEYQADCQLALL